MLMNNDYQIKDIIHISGLRISHEGVHSNVIMRHPSNPIGFSKPYISANYENMKSFHNNVTCENIWSVCLINHCRCKYLHLWVENQNVMNERSQLSFLKRISVVRVSVELFMLKYRFGYRLFGERIRGTKRIGMWKQTTIRNNFRAAFI